MKKLYGIGTGPGDPELLTLKAIKSIEESQVIFAPNNKGSNMALDTAREFIGDKRIVLIDFPMGFVQREDYIKAARLIEKEIPEASTGAFLTIGDPMIYSTFIYLMEEINKELVECQIVSGIPSFVAGAGLVQVPLTVKGDSFYLCDQLDENLMEKADSLAILKTLREKEDLLNSLEKHGFDYKYIKKISLPDQEIIEEKEEILKDKNYISLILARKTKKREKFKMKKNKLIILSLLLIGLLALTVACGQKNESDEEETDQDQVEDLEQEEKEEEEEDPYAIKIEEGKVIYTDDSGQELTIPQKPEKTVVLFSSFIDIWVKNGGQLIGMTEDELHHDIPGLENVEGVGKTGGLSLEKIISLEPELVVLSAGNKEQREMMDALRQNNVEVLALEYIGKEDYYRIATLFSKINDRADLYEENVARVEEEVNRAIGLAPEEELKVFIMFASSKSITARGSDSTLGEMLKDLNTINIADQAGELLDDKNFSIEKVIEEDPDFIFVQTRGADMEAVEERIKSDVESNPAWASLTAVKNNRYIVLPKELYLYKANDRYGEAYDNLLRILYEDHFN